MTVGATTARTAVVWARAPGAGTVQLEAQPPDGGESRHLAERAPAEHDFTVKLSLTDLAPKTRYRYRVAWRESQVRGEFRTAPDPGDPEGLTLLWSGDLGGRGRCRSPADGYPIFRAMAARRPDLFLFVGDTIYADERCPTPDNAPGADFRAADLAGFRAKHRYNRADGAVQALYRLTSVEAIWDDHEVVNNFAGPTAPLMTVGRRAFLEYWPIVPPAEEPGRLYRRIRWGRLLEIFILDTRQYRSPNAVADGPRKTMLGAAQRAWLLRELPASEATWKAVVSSVSLSIPTGRHARDSWARGNLPLDLEEPTGFEQELSAIVRRLAARPVRNLIWLVADVHRAEVLRHQPLRDFVFHELVAGPLSAGFGHPGFLSPMLNPTRVWGEGGFDNFGEIALTPAGLAVRVIDGHGRIRFEGTLRPER